MNAFLTELDVSPLPDGKNWKLLNPLQYCTDLGSGGVIITVPAGFVTDFASVPRVLWTIFPPEGKWDGAAVVHDYLYRNGGVIPNCTKVFTKDEADSIFRDAMKCAGVGVFTRNIMYQAVARFGKGSFKGVK